MQWAHPDWSWILVPATALLVWYHMRSLSDFSATQKKVSLLIRIGMLALLVAAICGPVLMRSTNKQMIIFAIDRSESVDESAREKADAFLLQARQAAAEADAEIRFLAFDRKPHQIIQSWPPKWESDADESNLESTSDARQADADSDESAMENSLDSEPEASGDATITRSHADEDAY